ncbi:DUF294 nucleotidyltransferase-like domain-containing protein [Neisseria weaveri]|uniref:Predicted signal-transduction protein containing cAMP-binding and CBS domains n=1 Tax=Neisseria weaveri TaxID=28091 RepID=A0A3S5CAZ8_9NEIS|nr:DUF294 nucleotidyltransferase-like domain-containing protein [Neisseria weaveri]EGV34684.1 putative CBS domain and cyclic nucleotide-regulated nucleotidyltransferase [Neisseria weaveri ATCC 51223]EGV35814.1 putative CBS domain and cyclic nucleotide-regulated nucleotidyltransferase [Neisseria weaveri LMG 5135]VEJ52028.1 Predicted signal-transduction protein containing cAMP-binding and CBS domains [Neisseria weaveri]
MDRFDFSYAPYDSLNPSQRQILQSSVNITFFDDEEVIIKPQQPIEHLYVIIKGLVKEIGAEGEVVALYHARDTFDTRALAEGVSQHQFIVAEQALVYTIPKVAVMQIVESNPQFGAYFYASVAEKFASLSENKNEDEFASLFTAKVKDACRNNTLWLEGGATILEAAQLMREAKAKSLLVNHEGKVGLFTESVFRNIVIAGASSDEPAHKWSTFDLISIESDDFIFNALLRMTQFNIQRVVVEENGKVVGALEQIDVLAYVSNHSHLVAQRLERAKSVDELVGIALQMTESIKVLRKNGVRAAQLAQLMQVLNSSLFEKAWRMIVPPEIYEQSCLIVMGSEGRGEQVLKTDQDNALILREGVDIQTAAEAAERFSEVLAELGYPPCKGKIMVNNPEWRKTLPEFKKMVSRWCFEPSPAAMMNLAIFIDAKSVAGDSSLLEEVKGHLKKHLSNDAGMLMTFARAIEQFDVHGQGFFSQLIRRESAQKMDIKKMGLFPVVHGVRALALEARLDETNTFERIQKLVQLNILDEQLGKDVAEAQRYLMEMRLKAGLLSMHNGQVSEPNQVDIYSLSTLERDLLKDALQVVKRFKNVVRHHFHLNA